MRSRRALVQAVVGGAAVPVAAPATVSVQLRCHFQPTLISHAPRRRTTANKTKTEKTPKTMSAKGSLKPAELRTATEEQPPVKAEATKTEFSVDDEIKVSVRAAVESNKSVSASTSRKATTAQAKPKTGEETPVACEPINDSIDGTTEQAVPQTQTATEKTSAGASTSPSSNASPANRLLNGDPVIAQRAERRRLASLQRRFLVGAYAALEATQDCPDPRMLAPRLSTEEIAMEKAEDNARRFVGTLLHVHLPPLSVSEAQQNVKAAPLSMAEATKVFADAFALTLHTVQQRWRTLAATTAAPMTALPETTTTATVATEGGKSSSGSSGYSTAALLQLSFLASPFSVAATQALGSRSPFQRAIVIESLAPLQWLETSFAELCGRAAVDLHDELRQHHFAKSKRSSSSSGAYKSEGDVSDLECHGQHRLAVACNAVRERAVSLVSAMESTAKSVGSRSLFAMRRQWENEVAHAAASRKRKSHRSPSSPADIAVRDTLLNTVNRVGLELHLVHVWLTRLCEAAPLIHMDGSDSAVSDGASSVEAVARQALNWGKEGCDGGEVPSVDQLQWMLATAMLEQVHTQPYRFHYSVISAAKDLKDVPNRAGRSSTKPAYVVEAKHLDGLAALVQFALSEREVYTDAPAAQDGIHASPSSQLDEALFALLTAFYAVLPSYAALLPAWQRALIGATGDTRDKTTARSDNKPSNNALSLEENIENGGALRRVAVRQRDGTLVASPTAVWDVVADRWNQQEEVVRQEGCLVAVWWLRLLPLWVSSVTSALQLRVVATVLVSNLVESSTDADADGINDSDVHRLTAQDVTSSLDDLLAKSCHFLRDVLRFDRVRYERSLVTSRVTTFRDEGRHRVSEHNGEDEMHEMPLEEGATGAEGSNSTKDDTPSNNNSRNEEGDDRGGALDGANALPPLQRNRGKRSLFYKPYDTKGSTILQDGNPRGPYSGSRSDSSDQRSRFVSRVRRRGDSGCAAGAAVTSAASSSSSLSQHMRSATLAEAHEKTSALFDTLVLSAEAPILLTHRYGLQFSHLRSSAVEESWAATAHAKSELWRLLFALPSAAAAATAATRSRDGTWKAARALRSVLPAAVLTLLPNISSSDATATTPSSTLSLETSTSKKRGKPAASHKTTSAGDKTTERDLVLCIGGSSKSSGKQEERTLRRVLRVLERVQELLGLSVIESLSHLLVSLGEVILRIQSTSREVGLAPRRLGAVETRSLRGTAVQREAVRAGQQFVSVVTIGATTMVAENPLSWESMNAAWQLQQLRFCSRLDIERLRTQQPQRKHGKENKKSLQGPVLASSAAMHAFAVQWSAALTKEIPFMHVRSRYHIDAVLANAQEILKVLQTPSSVAALPLYAKQVSMAALLQSLIALASHWRNHYDLISIGPSQAAAAASIQKSSLPVTHEEVMTVYRGVLDVLTADADLRLLCCYATFVENLYEVHLRLKADHAGLITWADQYLLPLVLPVVVAGLRRSQASHNAATHADLCETTLVLLSPLSRFAANPQVAMSDVLRTYWNQVLLQVSLYCIRIAGRGGVKRASDYGMPPVVLPQLTEPSQSSAWWLATFAHGAEPVFLSLLDQSNAVLDGTGRSVEPRDVDAADGVRDSLAAYLTAWGIQVRFGHRNWDSMLGTLSVQSNSSLDNDDVTVSTHELLRRWQVSCTAVQTFTGLTQPARVAGAEAAPFIASKPVKARQLGYLVRFMEHYLREQERVSRLSDEEMQALLSKRSNNAAAPANALSPPTSSATSATVADIAPSTTDLRAVAAPLSDTAPLVLLDFVGHLSSAGGWAMVTWSCNIAETVVKIELRRHRQIPEVARMVAATAILSQIRVVPPASNESRLSANMLKSLVSLSDVVASSGESLLGFYRRSPIQGLLCHPTRDQYRALTFGLKQATAYVQIDSRKYRAWQGAADQSVQRAAADGEASNDNLIREGEVDESSMKSSELLICAMSRKVGSYYAIVWASHLSKVRAAKQNELQRQETDVLTKATKDHNGDFRYYLSCLVCLIDACMESAQLYLLRQQGDGEEDIRVVVEAAVMELCRTLAANIQSILSLTHEQRRTCFYSEGAELLWASLCIAATISTVAPRDQKDCFFTPRCTQAIRKAFDLTQQLVTSMSEEGKGARSSEEDGSSDEGTAAVSGASSVNDSNDDKASAATVGAAPLLRNRPLTTALVRGAQLLLRDPRTSIRLSLRLAMRQRDRDDLTAVLNAFHVLRASARLYEPGRTLLTSVWARLALELTQPLPESVQLEETTRETRSGAGHERAGRAAVSRSANGFPVAAVVPSRSEYGVVLQELSTPPVVSATAVASSNSLKGSRKKNSLGLQQTEGGASPTAASGCDVTTALAHIVEDAATIQHERQRCVEEASAAVHDQSGSNDNSNKSGSLFSYGLWEGTNNFANSSSSFFTQPHLDIAAALESGTVSLPAVLDAAIAHSVTTARLAGGRSSFDFTEDTAVAGDNNNGGSGNGDLAAAVGFPRLIREHCQDLTDLLLHVPLRDIVTYPKAEVLFSCLHLIQGSVKPETENELWRLLAAKWKEELLDVSESTFLPLQQAQLTLLRLCRGVSNDTDLLQRVGHPDKCDVRGIHSLQNAPPPDFFAQSASSSVASPSLLAQAAGMLSVSVVAQQSMRDHWQPDVSNLHHSDDARRLVSNRKRSSSRKSKHASKDGALPQESFPGELDREATGVAALAAMPDPIPISVILTILKTFLRRRNNRLQQSTMFHSRAHAQRMAQTTWLAAGGGDGSGSSSGDDKGGQDALLSPDTSPFAEVVEVVMTYVARTYWLLRPRLDDGAWLVWATVERSMSAFPSEGGVRQQQWDRMCRQWRLPTSLDHARTAAGQLFSATERRRIAAWTIMIQDVCPGTLASASPLLAEGMEEVAVYCYLRSMSLYLQLLAMSMHLFMRQRIFGDLLNAAPDLVRRRLQMQQQQRSSNGHNNINTLGQDERTSRVASNEMLRLELQRLAQERQTQQEGVNRNLLEGAALQFLNVSWCLARHSDSLTHLSTDVAVAALTNATHNNSNNRIKDGTTPETTSAAVIAYADDVRLMVAGVLQDTLDIILCSSETPFAGRLAEHVVRTLLTSGFSCDALYLRLPNVDNTAAAASVVQLPQGQTLLNSGRDSNHSAVTASAVSVVQTILTASSNASASGSCSGGTAAAAAAVTPASAGLSSTSGVLNRIARAELFVGSPTWLAVLTPHFIKNTVMVALQGDHAVSTLLPITSALEFYLLRRNVPLSPLLEATTELLTRCPLRSSAVHTYCEHLATELTKRKEFRQALAPPTIASVEQGSAGSISNEAVISFVAAIARQDVHVTKKTLAHLLHTIMAMRLDVFGQPPTANRQGKLTLVQVGTTVDATIDTTNPLYTPKSSQQHQSKNLHLSLRDGTETSAGVESGGDVEDDDDAAAVMDAFSADKWSDFTAMTHRKALAALTLSLPTVMELAMHMDAMRSLDHGERHRAKQMLKAADDARRERVAMHRSQAHVAAAAAQGRHHDSVNDINSNSVNTKSAKKKLQAASVHVGKLDVSLHLEDPLDFGVAMLHLRYALRKIVHASLRRLLHQQGPRMLAEVATMLESVDPGMQSKAVPQHNAANVKSSNNDFRGGGGGGGSCPRPYDSVLAGTMRVLLSRAVLCAQAIGYDVNGAAIELPPLSNHRGKDDGTAVTAAPGDAAEWMEPQPVLKLPAPGLQASAVGAGTSALGTVRGRNATVGHSSDRISQLTKEEKAAVHQRVELEREAAVTVGLTTVNVSRQGQQRILRALRFTRRQLHHRHQKREFGRRRAAQRASPNFPFADSSSSSLLSTPKLSRLSSR